MGLKAKEPSFIALAKVGPFVPQQPHPPVANGGAERNGFTIDRRQPRRVRFEEFIHKAVDLDHVVVYAAVHRLSSSERIKGHASILYLRIGLTTLLLQLKTEVDRRKETMMLQKLSMVVAAMMLTASVANATMVQLQPIPDAFARLGHSCGGIKQQIFGEGFDAGGDVTGYVFAVTRCGGSGRGGGYRTTTYSTWVGVAWNLNGVVIYEATRVPSPDPSIAGAYHSGSLVGGANYPTCNNTSEYDNAFTCFSVPVVDGSYSVQTSLYVINQAACTASNTTYCTYRGLLTTP